MIGSLAGCARRCVGRGVVAWRPPRGPRTAHHERGRHALRREGRRVRDEAGVQGDEHAGGRRCAAAAGALAEPVGRDRCERAERRVEHHRRHGPRPRERVHRPDERGIAHRVVPGVGDDPVGPQPRVAEPLRDARRDRVVERAVRDRRDPVCGPRHDRDPHREREREDPRRADARRARAFLRGPRPARARAVPCGGGLALRRVLPGPRPARPHAVPCGEGLVCCRVLPGSGRLVHLGAAPGSGNPPSSPALPSASTTSHAGSPTTLEYDPSMRSTANAPTPWIAYAPALSSPSPVSA